MRRRPASNSTSLSPPLARSASSYATCAFAAGTLFLELPTLQKRANDRGVSSSDYLDRRVDRAIAQPSLCSSSVHHRDAVISVRSYRDAGIRARSPSRRIRGQ